MRGARVSSGLSLLVSSELCQYPENEAVLATADELIRSGGGKSLYKALLKRFSQGGTASPEAMAKLMALLEPMMEAQPGVSAYLMARLYARAHRQRDSVTCHAIELWMNGLATEEAADALAVLASEAVRAAVKQRCTQWADGIRKRARLIDARS
jgi:hypothetical protein